jgi:hypothetical protein|tara:strand:+ start:4055 stop:4474 length:420 start_codon:yes stop_codon:yes gene_type:complete
MEVKLRPLTINDLSFLLETRNDDSTRFYLEDDSVFNLEECKEWFKTLTSPWFIIEINNIRVGYLRTKDNEVGCDIHPNFRKKGYARMAYNEYLKDKDYAALKVFEDNFAKSLYLSLGFKKSGDEGLIRGRKYIKMEYNG